MARASMPPLVLGATAAAVLTALAGLDAGPRQHAPLATPPAASGVTGLAAPCAPGTLPEGPVCIRTPDAGELSLADAGAPRASGESVQRPETSFERIARAPDRPADPAAYVYPAGGDRGPGGGPRILEDADRPGVRLAVTPSETVRVVMLDHQTGPAVVVFAGEMFGTTVVTAHPIESGGHKRTVLLFHGGLDRAAPAASIGARLEGGAELGFARADLGGGLIDVYVEAREAREGVKLEGLDPKRLKDAATAVPTDLRNVLRTK